MYLLKVLMLSCWAFSAFFCQEILQACKMEAFPAEYFLDRITKTEEWSEEQLEKIVSRDCLVGVSVPEGDK